MILGLAISGGVDSMALATLCSQLQKAEPRRVSFHGFVVDHGLREGSRAEAEKVARFLKKLGMFFFVLVIFDLVSRSWDAWGLFLGS